MKTKPPPSNPRGQDMPTESELDAAIQVIAHKTLNDVTQAEDSIEQQLSSLSILAPQDSALEAAMKEALDQLENFDNSLHDFRALVYAINSASSVSASAIASAPAADSKSRSSSETLAPEMIELPNDLLARIAVHSAKTGQPVDAIIRAATEELLLKLESDPSSATASAPAADDAGAMSDALSDLEVQIELLRMCGNELLAKVGGLTVTPTEAAISSVTFFFGPMHEAFGAQLCDAFAKVHRLAIERENKTKQEAATQP